MTAGGAATPAEAGRGYQTRPFLKIRRGYTDLLTATKRKNIIHGLVEIASRMPSGCCGSVRRRVTLELPLIDAVERWMRTASCMPIGAVAG